jgi:hypothetical protein
MTSRLFRPRNLRAIDREFEVVVRQFRLEELAARLSSAPQPVVRTTYRSSRKRVRFDLDDGTSLELRLFWRRRCTAAALEALEYDDRIGWIVTVRTDTGDHVVFYSWLAHVEEASTESAQPRSASADRTRRT